MTDPRIHGAEGDERIRTAVPDGTNDPEYEGRLTAGESGIGHGGSPRASAARVAAPESVTGGVPAPAVSLPHVPRPADGQDTSKTLYCVCGHRLGSEACAARARAAVPSVAIEDEYEGENARRILHAPRKSGIVGRWRVGDVVETQQQAELLQRILDGRLTVVAT